MALRAYEQQGVGERLRHAREQGGIDLDRAAAETRIERRFLQALESDAPADVYPGPVFARSFLREYARYLGLNPRPLIEAYRASHPERDWPFLGGREPLERRSGWRRGALALVVVVAAVVATLLASRPDDNGALRVPDVPTTEPRRNEGDRTLPRGPGEPAIRGVRLRVRLPDEASWVSVVAGNREVIRETLEPGFVRTFRHPRRLEVVIGNADAASVTLNGRPLELVGAEDDVYRAEITYRNGRVRVAPEP